jgi:hypothetical protein
MSVEFDHVKKYLKGEIPKTALNTAHYKKVFSSQKLRNKMDKEMTEFHNQQIKTTLEKNQ